ncbi:MAG TPA: methyltransferase domain-containing protein [Pyrinomonadaceae bacterium]
MSDILFDIGAELDAKTLAARLKESATKRVARARGSSEVADEGRTGDVFEAQTQFNQTVSDALRLIAQNLRMVQENFAALERELNERDGVSRHAKEHADRQAHHIWQRIEEMKQRFASIDAQSRALEQKMSQELERLRNEELAEIRASVIRVERALRHMNRNEGDASPEVKTAAKRRAGKTDSKRKQSDVEDSARRVMKAGTSVGGGRKTFDYFMFEQRFRGSLAEIKRHQSIYLENFLERRNVVDLGCGRGEFVELLSEQGIGVTGVDGNAEMVAFCRERGLRVVHADLFEYLDGVADASLDGIFVSQVVEHFGHEEIAVLIELFGRKLERGGVVLAETVNPHCPVALGNFYLDPSHVRPIPAELLRFMFEDEGFVVRVLKFSGAVYESGASEVLDVVARLPLEASLYQDYAVVAIKL